MGRQYHFAMEGADEKLFMEYLKDNGYIVYLERTHRMPEIIEEFPASFSDAWFICIYHPAFGDMKFKSYMLDGKSNTKIDYIESMTEPVIEFTRTLVCHEEKKIRSGRIWMQMKYWNEYDELVSKSENLDKGFKDIKKWIKKHLQNMEQKNERGKVEKIAVSKELVRLFEEEGYHW